MTSTQRGSAEWHPPEPAADLDALGGGYPDGRLSCARSTARNELFRLRRRARIFAQQALVRREGREPKAHFPSGLDHGYGEPEV
eukprot:CAMPEP_0170172614 /NCGR_PEP_ID=MMETSP0040_2-20121228/5859_1 /TAXON_ID=641309 /ORGANISM="Lotharella oceanica, Strain CCMP622" /LENGTH=83 /DNA_ID=CAMNT_0010413365 /DNA_START=553 /DNA_END=805 /DNA_ORIENTATION=+